MVQEGRYPIRRSRMFLPTWGHSSSRTRVRRCCNFLHEESNYVSPTFPQRKDRKLASSSRICDVLPRIQRRGNGIFQGKHRAILNNRECGEHTWLSNRTSSACPKRNAMGAICI